jgi:hypothetical protein
VAGGAEPAFAVEADEPWAAANSLDYPNKSGADNMRAARKKALKP